MVMPLLVPLYNRIEPRLFGLPFFYWYQLACVADRDRDHHRGLPADQGPEAAMAAIGDREIEIGVFVFLLGVMLVVAFMASRWRRPRAASTASRSGASAAGRSATG